MFKMKSFVPIDKVLLYTLNTTAKDIDLMQPKILNNIGKCIYMFLLNTSCTLCQFN